MRLTSAVLVASLCASISHTASAWRTSQLAEAIEGEEIMEMLGSLPAIEKKESDPQVYTFIKYTVLPSKAEAFIKVIKEAKEGAKSFDGYVTYDVIKTLEDNTSYYVWNVWNSNEDRRSYWKSETAKKLLDFIAEEDILTTLSAARPVV